MKLILYISVLVLLVIGCKKSEDRTCYKGYGELTELEYDLDSVEEFKLYKNIKYRFYQDSAKKIVVRTGTNMVNLIDVQSDGYVTSIHNYNRCGFLRDADKLVEVDIYYPHYKSIYAEPTDSIIFMDTLRGDKVNWHLRDGGGTLLLNVDVNHIVLSVSYGVGNYVVAGESKYANLSIQNRGRGDALNLKAKYISIYHNSAADLLVNLDSAEVDVLFYANGDVRFTGVPDSLNVEGVGEGEVITYN